MSAKPEQLTAKKITFFTACRENTGAALCDSGGAYGRWHEAAPIDPGSTPAIKLELSEDREYLDVTLSTPHYLDANFEIDRKLQGQFERWLKKHPEGSWFENGQEFMEELGYTQQMRGNPYNSDNDLSQVFVFEVWNLDDPGGHKNDGGLYATDTTVTVFYMHTGCDVRGGYGRPIFSRGRHDYAIPADVVVGFHIMEGTDAEGNEIKQDQARELDETWQIGYSDSPKCRLDDDVEEWLKIDDEGYIHAKLKTGETVKILPYMQEY